MNTNPNIIRSKAPPVVRVATVTLAVATFAGCGGSDSADTTAATTAVAPPTTANEVTEATAPTPSTVADAPTTVQAEEPATTEAASGTPSINDAAVGTDVDALRAIMTVPGEPLGVWYGGFVADTTVADPQPDEITYVAVIEYGRLSDVDEAVGACGAEYATIDVPAWFPQGIQDEVGGPKSSPLPVLETQLCDDSEFERPTELGANNPRFVFVRLTADDIASLA